MKYRAVFLDKDGTLLQNVPYNIDPGKMVFTAHAEEGLKKLTQAGYLLVVISNQSGVARGYFAEEKLIGVEGALRQMIWKSAQVPLAGFYYCPHLVDGAIDSYAIDCDCRKPKPGMLFRAASDLDIDLTASWMVGDILDDIEAGKKACCRTVLIDNGNETEWKLVEPRIPDYVAVDLFEAATKIVDTPTHPAEHPQKEG